MDGRCATKNDWLYRLWNGRFNCLTRASERYIIGLSRLLLFIYRKFSSSEEEKEAIFSITPLLLRHIRINKTIPSRSEQQPPLLVLTPFALSTMSDSEHTDSSFGRDSVTMQRHERSPISHEIDDLDLSRIRMQCHPLNRPQNRNRFTKRHPPSWDVYLTPLETEEALKRIQECRHVLESHHHDLLSERARLEGTTMDIKGKSKAETLRLPHRLKNVSRS